MTIPYAGLGLDRATDRRADPAWVAALAAGGQAQVWPLWRDQCLVAGDPPVPVALPAGGYSLLAGFLELGESLEDAVRREIFEEAGVALREVRYAGSQPWPFPAGLMVAFRATAAGESVSVDGSEIVEARWFTRAELRQYEQARGQLGRVDSVDRVLLAAWLAEGDQSTPTRARRPAHATQAA